MKKLLLLLLFISLITVFMTGCGKKETNVSRGNEESILYLGNGLEPQDLDPQTVTGVPEQRIIGALLEGLVAENPETLAPVPGVAESWKVSRNGLVYTFFIRKNAEWSNGTPVTADDFVFSYRRILSPALGSQNAYMLYPLKNAKKYNQGTIKDFSKVGVKALSSHVLQLTLDKPVPYFMSLLTHMAWYPVNKQAIEKYGSMTQRGTKWTLPGHYVCNGPFVLKTWHINQSIELVKNPKYWDAENVKLNKVVFYPISNNQTEEHAFRAGQLHVTYTIPTSKIAKYQKDDPGLINIAPYLGTYYLVFNVKKYPYTNPLLRKALTLAIDRVALAKYVIKGGKEPANSFTPPDTAGYTSGTSLSYDVEKARTLLTEAGYPNGKGLPALELIYNSSARNRRIAAAIQAMWQKNLNIRTSLVNKEWKVYLDSFRTKDFSIATASWIGDYNDPSTFLDMWLSDSGNNRAGWSNKTYDKLITQASNTSDRKARYKLFKEAEKILISNDPVIPLFYYTSLALIRPEVKGWHKNILDHHPFKKIYLQKTI